MISSGFSAIARSEAQTQIQKFGFEYLKKQKSMNRPLSPHLNIYKPQLTWMLSGAHRVSGSIMGGSKALELHILNFYFSTLSWKHWICASSNQLQPVYRVCAQLEYSVCYHWRI
jgi:succinate dehydrogenase/fumarate reductase cytochrome b subunit